ncbi:SHOCT domain-containing protein [Streptomyces sp. NPDC006208]|uniref:SHOCT domain-containing protein n=1 Tax=Streptomyces sp. NPDC006208 TaxID=3156734 RepID=UPI0033B46F8F
MMFWYRHDLSGWGWLAMSLGMILFWALIITAGFLLPIPEQTPRACSHPCRATPEQILGDRLARGDINEDEYRRLLNALPAFRS